MQIVQNCWNKLHREGKYWFKSGCPTPDPRWPAVQQLMVPSLICWWMDGCCIISEIVRLKYQALIIEAGPIPGDCDYSELRTAFLSHGQTCHLFIQNNQVTILTSFGCRSEFYVPGMAWKEPGEVWVQTGHYTEHGSGVPKCFTILSSGQVWICGVHWSRNCGAPLQARRCRGAQSFWGADSGLIVEKMYFL